MNEDEFHIENRHLKKKYSLKICYTIHGFKRDELQYNKPLH